MKVLVTGGVGFVGSHVSDFYASQGHDVMVFDNLSRKGVKKNEVWLTEKHGKKIKIIHGDIRHYPEIAETAKDRDLIFHLAAQVAVTTSVTDPREDFDVNALGTLNVLEAARTSGNNPILLFTSTNKVYGGMEDVKVVEKETRYEYDGLPNGVPESRGLDFHSPYGCSKGAADQYVRDYSRIYGLRTVVFRMSCIYGTRQFGNEDQGWVAHFVIMAAHGKDISIYGDGKQVRDILFVEDLVQAMNQAVTKIDRTSGQVYNIGGGPAQTISVWREFYPVLKKLTGRETKITLGDWRPGDQKVYISDTRKVQKELDWKPKISVEEGIEKLYTWVKNNPTLFT